MVHGQTSAGRTTHSPSRGHGCGLHFAHLQTESSDGCLHEVRVCKKLAGEAVEMGFSSMLHLRGHWGFERSRYKWLDLASLDYGMGSDLPFSIWARRIF